MRLQVNRVSLIGTSREVEFEPGLNVIVGPISTGKSSLMRLLRVLLGGDYELELPEVRAAVTELAGQVVIGDQSYAIRRRLVTTPTADVQIAAEDEALSLPAMRPTSSQPVSYGDWMLEKLGLPQLRIPSAPTRPAESEPVRVSINDYLRYCRLTQEEIDTDVLGSSVWFKDNKRRMVFRILYGSYDAEVALLQQQLRDIAGELRLLEGQESASKLFLEGTPFANRASIESQLGDTRNRRDVLRGQGARQAVEAVQQPHGQRLRARVNDFDSELSALVVDRGRERESVSDLTELRNQLQTQSGRLTRAIVAGDTFFDFDFRVCPRCGSGVHLDRASDGCCYLCTQPEPEPQGREDLIREQTRVAIQISETDDLVANHERAIRELDRRIETATEERQRAGQELDDVMAAFVSDHGEEASQRAAEMARLEAEERRLGEYLALFERQEQATQRIAQLNAERDPLEDALRQAEHVDAAAEDRIEALEARFAHYVDAIDVPRFENDPQPRAAIDRSDYEPIVNGRKIGGLSAGTRVLVNVAHSLGHHLAAPELDIPLPGILLIDGMTANIGEADYDAQRIDNIWTELISLSEDAAEDLQMIVAVNDVPPRAESFVRLRLSPEDRLVPAADLARARGGPSGD
jgi:ribosomal protein S27AE